ncbi:hypothetical protein SteCoe_4795 [Stentor coeruleus]|uniref:Uncharacterized protein n=1 Tax=Stentor coeruleus TaxID=5963 RepID=A0A1R2CTU9_9CILI|nr:hypothetical protein SteCoe_4795 [Stentor coeruleus]
MKPASVIPKQEQSSKIILDISIIEKLINIGSYLLDIDMKNSQYLQSLGDSIKSFSRTKRVSKILKCHLLNLEKIVYREKKAFTGFIEEMASVYKNSSKNHSPTRPKGKIDVNEKVKKILQGLVHGEVIKNYDKIVKCSFPIKLLSRFYIEIPNEEPELEIHSNRDGKKFFGHMKFLIKTLEKVALDLMKILCEYTGINVEKAYEEDKKEALDFKGNKSISPNELKIIKVKINRLHNRGSLTDDEARNMLGKISAVPVSPDIENSQHLTFFKANVDTLPDATCDDDPVTETREKKQKLNASISKNLKGRAKSFKRVKSFKGINKRNSTPVRTKVRKSLK